jgi:predicted PurR-regulated permease PerM
MSVKNKVDITLGVIWGMLVRFALVAGLAYFLYKVTSILVAVILAITLAYAVLPMVDFLCRWRIRGIRAHTQRLIATILVFVLLIFAVGMTFKLFMDPFRVELVKLQSKLHNNDTLIENLFNRVNKVYNDFYNTLSPDLQKFISKQDIQKLVPSLEGFVGKVLNSTILWLGHIMHIVLIPVLAFYFVLDSRSLRREFVGLVPRRRLREALFILRDIGLIMQSYIIGQFILCLIAGVLTGAVLYALGLDYALVLAVFAAVTRAIPAVGPVISGIPITILGGLQDINTGVILLIFVTVLHFAESKFIMPKLIGDRMKLHPAIVIIVLLIGAEFFGVLGMFLAAPVAAIVRELIRIYILHAQGLRTKKYQRMPREVDEAVKVGVS